jgi:glycerophosphoryl diester phosphodiesterase
MTICMAHRGFAWSYPENTLLAFQKAIELGVDAMELDVRKTKDDVVVVSHDGDLKRCSGKPGIIEELTYQEIQEYQLPENQKIPKLEEVLNLIKYKPVKLNIEFKAPDIESTVLKLVDDVQVRDQVIISSFNFEILQKIRALRSDVFIGYIRGYTPKEQLPTVYSQAQQLKAQSINLNYRTLNRKIIEQIHQLGMQANAWTIDFSWVMKRFAKMGADVITSNRPDVLKRVLKK